MDVSLLGLTLLCEHARGPPAGDHLSVVIVGREGELGRPETLLQAVLPAEVHPVHVGGVDERPSLQGRVIQALSNRQRPLKGRLGAFVVGLSDA